MKKLYLDQHGNNFFASSLKELKAQVSGKVSLMYAVKKDGSIIRCGYVIGQHWLTEYVVNEKPV